MFYDRSYLGLMGAALSDAALVERASELACYPVRARRINDTRFPVQCAFDAKALLAGRKAIYGSWSGQAHMPPASIRFLDGFYMVEKSLAMLENSGEELTALMRGLPVCAAGEFTGLPRAWSVAAALVGHSGGRVNEAALEDFLGAYQRINPLAMHELASLPDLIRLALIRFIRIEGDAAVQRMQEMVLAQEAADTLGKIGPSSRRASAYVEKLMLPSRPACAEGLITLLFERDERGLMDVVYAALAREDADAEAIMVNERRAQVRNAERLGDAINSLRMLDALDASAFFERFSTVERILRENRIYADMDAQSRAHYRRIAERLAKRLSVAEPAVARAAVALARNKEDRAADTGWWLFGGGERELWHMLRPDRRFERFGDEEKLWAVLTLELALILPMLALAAQGGVIACLLSILPAWSIAHTLTMRLMGRCYPVRHIPRMDTSGGGAGTIVAVPVLIVGERDVCAALEQLETHYLANPLERCVFAVLGDFKDAAESRIEGEDTLIELMQSETERLNAKYPQAGGARFIFLLRRRELSPYDGIYMGRERKRGALMDLAALVCEGRDDPFELMTSKLPEGLRYCLTLDADTILPRETLKKLIGAMEHPMNQPVLSDAGVVTLGHGVIVPAMRETQSGASKSAFARIMSRDGGLDAYAGQAGEFFEDVFGTGLFGGKGIFDIATFYRALVNNIPENTVLSHDLLEGCFLRAGFMGDVALYDAEPATFNSWWKRKHRWLRGDWQLMPFMGRHVRDAAGAKHRNPLSILSRLKLFENIRRSLLPLAALLCVLVLPYLGVGAYIWIALAAYAEGFVLDVIGMIKTLVMGKSGGATIKEQLEERGDSGVEALLDLTTLPFAALRTVDAIARTLYRMFVSRRNLLEWQTAAQSAGAPKDTLGYCRMLLACLIASAVMAAGRVWGHAPFAAGVFTFLFLFAPLMVEWLDRPEERKRLGEEERELVLDAAKRTWRFFEAFCTEENAFLPPDNFQEFPLGETIRNTSPTNIGMAIMAMVSAHALKLIDDGALVTRLGRLSASVERMEKWNGHLYNWYSLKPLSPLEPRYVSAVDSGNLAACLLTAESALLGLDLPEARPLGQRLRALALGMDFSALYDKKRKLFHIGFDCRAGKLTESWYDLLASESRLTSFMAVALGRVEVEHWHRLSRLLVAAGGGRTLISWSGTMFEYLMPTLFTGLVSGTLLGDSCENAIRAQIAAVDPAMPWGISESGYYAFDRAMLYQYRAFGVNALALSPAREHERVISPYSTMLALSVDPPTAAANLRRLIDLGAMGAYGLYEALDFTPARVNGDAGHEMVRSFMAHHQGMALTAAANALTENAVCACFLRIGEVRATRLLLEERRPPVTLTIRAQRGSAVEDQPPAAAVRRPRPRVSHGAFTVPETQLLTNGRYTVFIADNGLGYSQCEEVMLTRWRRDPLRSDSGVHFLINDGGSVYSIGSAPVNAHADEYTVTLEAHCVEFTRRTGDIEAKLEVVVSPRLDGEVRTLKLANLGDEERALDIGVFADICLAGQEDDEAHPAFVKLTVDARRAGSAVLYERRRVIGSQWAYAAFSGPTEVRYASDRLAFLGRGRTYASAMQALLPSDTELSMPVEPGFCGRTSIRLGAGKSAEYVFILGFANERQKAERDASELLREADATLQFAWAYSSNALRFAGLGHGKAALFERMAARLIFGVPMHYAKVQPGLAEAGIDVLWKYGISGDEPIMLIRAERTADVRMVRTMLELHGYLSMRGVRFDPVVIGEYPNEYANDLRLALEDVIQASGRMGLAHLLHGFMLSEDEREAIRALSLVELMAGPSIDKQFAPILERDAAEATNGHVRKGRGAFAIKPERLAFDNGVGGFSLDGSEYVITMGDGAAPPLPWCNVLANEHFGSLVSELGGGYTWSKNARENKLTPWRSDPARELVGEAVLIQDCDDGAIWTIAPGVPRTGVVRRVRHGFGYTAFECDAEELNAELMVFVDQERPVKYALLTLKNPMMRSRRLYVTACAEWVLGDVPRPGAVRVRFEGNIAFASNLRRSGPVEAYLAIAGSECEASGNLAETLSGGWAEGGSEEAFSALRTRIVLEPGEERRIVILLGEDTEANAKCLAACTPGEILERLEAVRRAWRARVGCIRVSTPDEAMNIMLNGWLMYQTWSARLMGRTGFYQCGGAVGFRDQLQDILSIMPFEPERAKGHILLAAARQFEEGDVLHWWHPPYSGVRTRITDDRLFLPYAVMEFIEVEGDWGILDESAPYLEGEPLPDCTRDLYRTMRPGERQGSIYEHCARAVDISLARGAHGLALMGGGDWNDGMDHAGDGGGESVWLTMFLIHILERFAPIARGRGDEARASEYERAALAFRSAVETSGRAGSLYARAWLSDGRVLGGGESGPLAIDLISQAWAVIAGLDGARQAFESALRMLVDEEHGVIRLLTPPFYEIDPEVGYISAYIPGVRENGGQYTHAAAWLIWAASTLNEPAVAMKLFRMLNPITHTSSALSMRRYKAEPYVLAGDVYSEGKNAGRGGWTWYTGAAGWLWRAGVERILGVRKQGDALVVSPCTDFDEYSVEYRYKSTVYELVIKRKEGAEGSPKGESRVPLTDDGLVHRVQIEF